MFSNEIVCVVEDDNFEKEFKFTLLVAFGHVRDVNNGKLPRAEKGQRFDILVFTATCPINNYKALR